MSPEVSEKLAQLTEDERALLRPLVETSKRFYVLATILALVVLWGMIAYFLQVRFGLGRTGLNRPEYWGIYIINFVFFIGISHAGTLISAILRVAKAEWRRAITRSAELITVLVPDRALNIIFNAQISSPLLWDVASIGLYFAACTTYLYVPLLPDLARIRDLGIKAPGLYRFLAAGYTDTPSQRARLSDRRLGTHRDRLDFRHDAAADVAQYDLRAVLRDGSDLFRYRRNPGRDVHPHAGIPPGEVLQAGALRLPGPHASSVQHTVVLFHLCRVPHRFLWSGTGGDANLLG